MLESFVDGNRVTMIYEYVYVLKLPHYPYCYIWWSTDNCGQFLGSQVSPPNSPPKCSGGVIGFLALPSHATVSHATGTSARPLAGDTTPCIATTAARATRRAVFRGATRHSVFRSGGEERRSNRRTNDNFASLLEKSAARFDRFF